MAMTNAERQRAFIARLKAGTAPAKPVRKPKDRRSRPTRWTDAIGELFACLNDWQAARDVLPPSLAETAYAEKLDAILELRELVEQLDAADVPRGFGRD